VDKGAEAEMERRSGRFSPNNPTRKIVFDILDLDNSGTWGFDEFFRFVKLWEQFSYFSGGRFGEKIGYI